MLEQLKNSVLFPKDRSRFCTLSAERISKTVFTNCNMNRLDKLVQDLEVCRKKPSITPSNECPQAQNSYGTSSRDSACRVKMHLPAPYYNFTIFYGCFMIFPLSWLSQLCAWDRAEISNNALAPPRNNGSSQWVPILGRKHWKCAAKMELKSIWCQSLVQIKNIEQENIHSKSKRL